MSDKLHSLGKFSFQHKWSVLASWLIILAITTGLMFRFQQPATSDISIPGTEAQRALDDVRETFPSAAGASGRVVFKVPEGQTIDDYQAPVAQTLTRISNLDSVDIVVSPFEFAQAVSEDRNIAYAQVQFDSSAVNLSKQTIDRVTNIVEESRTDGLTVELGGDVTSGAPGDILGIGEVVGVAVALIVLLITLGSLIAAGMPLLIAVLTVGIGATSIFALSSVVDMDSTTPVLAIMLGLAVGIDYSLFIISKYRGYLAEGVDYEAAASRSIATAGNAVVFAAATVVIALAALAVVQIPFMTTMGFAGAATVAIAAIVAITLVPALLGLAKGRVFGKKRRREVVATKVISSATASVQKNTVWYKWGSFLARRPIAVIVATIIVLGAIALPARELNLGLPTAEFASTETTERRAYNLLSEGFGPGFNGPLLILVKNMPEVTQETIDAARQQILTQQQAALRQADPTQVPSAEQQAAMQEQLRQASEQLAQYSVLQTVATNIQDLDGVVAAIPAGVNENGTTGILQVVPTTGPSDDATFDLITYIRNNSNDITSNDSLQLSVTGTTALQADIDEKLFNALPLYLGVVVGLSFLILMVAFRSILVPLKATIGFLLSVLAMFGAIVMAFQWGWLGVSEPSPIISFLPIIGIGVLFGLAMDYEFFLVSSMHESYVHKKDAKKAVVEGFAMGSKVVTAAAIIMVAVFAGFIFSDDDIIRQIGFALAFGVLVDAMLVRMTLVPAVMSLLGKSAWWLPAWLDKILPRVSIEGKE